MGPNQDQLGSDGIGDTPYVIDANNQDRYPLMQPWSPPPELEEYFTISASPESQTILQGESTTYTVEIASALGYAAEFTFSLEGLPADTSYSFDPPSIYVGPPAKMNSSTLAITTTSTTPTGTYTLIIKAVAISGGISTTVALTVSAVPVVPEVEVTWEMIYEADDRVCPGDIVMYKVTVTNLDTTTINDVKVTLTSKAGTPISVSPEAATDNPDEYKHPTSITDAEITQLYGDIPPGVSKSKIFSIWIWLDKNVRPGEHLFLQSVYDVSSNKWTYYYDDVWRTLQLTTGSWDLGIQTAWVTGSTKNSLTVDVKKPDFSNFYPDTNENGHPDVIVRIGERDGYHCMVM